VIPKPATCAGCVAYTTSQHWVPDKYVPGSKVLVLQGEVSEYEVRGIRVTGYTSRNQYSTESARPSPLNGVDGYELTRSYLCLAGLNQDEVSCAAAIRCLTGLTSKAQQEAATYCQQTHFHPPESVELVVALGPVAAQAMGLEGKIEQWRGHVTTQEP
jgi:hypothetical protein